MKFKIIYPPSHTFRTLFRHLGYHPDANRRTGDESYSRRLGRGTYPRFHVYVHIQTDGSIVLNLHLDMKKPSYVGHHAHNAEYEGELVKAEHDRLAKFFQGD